MSMAEKSIFWTTGATGDGATAYTQAEVIRWMRQMWLADDTEEGVQKGYENDLEPTGAATPVAIDTGAAIIYGFPYWNTASVNVAIATPAGNTRIDRIVLRASWAAQTIRITRIAGAEGSGIPPVIVQTDGVTWDLKICQVSITTGGTITLTDERDWVRPNIGVDENMLDASVAGDALTGGDGSALDVVPGTNLEISSDTIRIAASAAGDGLQGGAGSALAVDVSDFAGDGLVDDGSENLDVNVDDATIEIDTDALQLKDEGHGPTQHANRTRQLLVDATRSQNTTDATEPLEFTNWGTEHPTDKLSKSWGNFMCPDDFVSGMTIKGVWLPLASVSGETVFTEIIGSYFECGEDISSHHSFSTSGSWGPTTNDIACVNSASLGAMAKDHMVKIEAARYGLDVNDDFPSTMAFIGFLVEYTADQ